MRLKEWVRWVIQTFMSQDWVEIHEEVVSLGKERSKREHALGRALLRARRAKVWEPLGMATLAEYAERTLGLSARQCEERVRVAEALESLPRIGGALAAAELHFSSARAITRVATPETEDHWLVAARELTAGQIEKLVAGRKPGDRPDDPERPTRRRLVMDVSPEVYALFRDASAVLRRQIGEPLDREAILLLMARQVLGGPQDEGRSSYQIRMMMCTRCGRAEQEGRGESIAVDGRVAEAAECDAQRLDDDGRARQDIPPATRRRVMRRQHGRCGVPACRNATFTEIHHVTFRADGGTHDPDELVVLCGAHHSAVHRGTLRIEGTWSSGIRYLRADGSPYGSPAGARLAAVFADVVAVLRRMGWNDQDVRAMIDAVRPHVGPEISVVDAVRMALRGPTGGPMEERASAA